MNRRVIIRKVLFSFLLVNYIGVFLVFSTYHGHLLLPCRCAVSAEITVPEIAPSGSHPPGCMICVILNSTLPFLFHMHQGLADIGISPLRTEQFQFASVTLINLTQSRSPPTYGMV